MMRNSATTLITATILALVITPSAWAQRDTTFSTTGFNSTVNSLAVQPDGKILVGGLFIVYSSLPTNTAAYRIARLNPDGTLDNTFTTGVGFNSIVSLNSLVVQSDGKILVGGSFTSYNGTAGVNRIARLNNNGSLDTTFNIGTGFNNTVSSLAVQSDGKILVGGQFGTYNGSTVNRIARLNNNGILDTSFNNGGAGFNGLVNSLAVQSDGKILVGGAFNTYNGTTVNRLARLNADGSLDTSFTNNAGTGFDGSVYNLALQADGKILAVGLFSSYDVNLTPRIARLNADGTIDNTFTTGVGVLGFNNVPYALAVQSDGKILLGGQFTTYNGTTVNRIARLNPDGSRDTTLYNSALGFNQVVNSLAVQSDGKILVGGAFSAYDGTSVGRIARLLSVIPTPTLSVTNSPQVYTGSPIAATVTCSSTGALTNIQYNGSSTVPTNAGTYAITADCAGDSSYATVTGASAGNFVISRSVPTLSVSNSPQPYTGSGIAAQVACLGGGTATVTNYSNGSNYSSVTAPTAAGTYTVTASCAQSTNYAAQTGLTVTFVITAPATVPTPISNTALLTIAGMLAMAGWWMMEQQRQRV